MESIKQRLQSILETTEWSVDDRKWLQDYFEQDDTSELRQIMQQEFAANTNDGDYELNDETGKRLLELIHKKVNRGTAKILKPVFWSRIAAAAVLILIAGATYLLVNKNSKDQPIAQTQEPVITDIAPGGNKAVLTLADGSTIVLDSAANGTLSQQGNTKVLKLDNGQLAYNSVNEKQAEVLYNTISTPKGGQYQLVLSDGSKVWLNAASSLRYPASLIGKERRVELTGEGYFEIAKNASMPFKVDVAGKGEVEVLGTHFNINSYADELTINTTLLEGKVKMTSGLNSQLLVPGQQARLNASGQINLNKDVDVEEVVAWKNGKFIFDNADIQSIMRQVERWYDVEAKFEGNITKEEFVGIISRNVNISQIITMLEKTGAVKFKIDGRKIIVK